MHVCVCVAGRGGVISSVDVCVGGRGGGRVPCFTVIIFYNIEGPNSSIYSSKGFRYKGCNQDVPMIWAHFFSFSCSMIGRVIGGVCGGIDQINKFPSTPLRHPPLMMIKTFFPQNFSPFLIKFLIKEGSIRKLVMLYRITHFWKSPKSTTVGREFLFSFKTVVKHYSESLFEQ